MTEPNPQIREFDTTVEDLALRFAEVLTAVASHDEDSALRDFEHLLGRAQDLVVRKQSMQGTKSETRDLIAELLFSKMRKAFRLFLKAPRKPDDEIRAAEWILGAVIGNTALADFASALDAAILRGSGPKDYSFAGCSDFIAIEEVMQMIGSGKHTGCLSFEKHDNRLDIYINRGQIAFLDPHHIVRRVLPGTSTMRYREIAAATMEEAVQRHAQDGVPVFLTLVERGEFREFDTRAMMRQLGTEVLFDFMRQQGDSHFSYRRMDQLPRFVLDNELRLGVTPVLLEVSRRLDDWRSMTRAFPDPSRPIEPMPDMLARISGLNLGILEIKLLTMIDGENSPESLTALIGLPIFDVYQFLVTFAQEGAIVAPGGPESLLEVNLSAEDSMRDAFEALDANDDQVAMNSALDKVLGDDDSAGLGRSGLGFLDDRF